MIIDVSNWQAALRDGFDLHSSGTTGVAKTIFQTPEKLRAAGQVALEAQSISSRSRILTVCNMHHAGGLLAQTLPAWSVGALVDIKPFNAFRFVRDMRGYTHTHLTPTHCALLMQTRSFQSLDMQGLFVTCGSDPVSFDMIAAFVERGAVFMCNWGMTEIGPITINTVFASSEKVRRYREQAMPQGSLLGDRFYCDYKIENEELWVKGDVCVYPGWFNTHDRVVLNSQGALYYLGRSASG